MLQDLSIGDATAAPARLSFKGTEYIFSPLRHADWGEFERWMQGVEMQNGFALLAKLNGEFTDDVKEELRKEIVRKALTCRLGTNKFTEHTMTIPGISMIVWMRLRQNHPDITIDQVGEMLMSPEFQDVVDAAESLLDGPDRGGSGTVAGKPRTRSKRKRSKTVKKRKKKSR